MTFWKKQNHRNRNQIGGCQKLGVADTLDDRGAQGHFRGWVIALFYVLIILVVKQFLYLSKLTELYG